MKHRYVLEYDNGLKVTVYSVKKLQDLRIKVNNEGLRSICQKYEF